MNGKKILAGIMSLTMISSMGIGAVRAEYEKGNVTSFNADPEAMYIYHTVQYLGGDNVKASTKIIQNGVDITEGCTFERYETKNLYGGGLGTTWDRPYCTKVTPPSGTTFDINEPITVSIENQASLNDYSNTFMIAELLSDDFSGSTLDWRTDNSKSTLAVEDGRLKVTGGYNVPVYHKDYASQKNWSDYTVSFDYEPAVESSTTLNYVYSNTDSPNGSVYGSNGFAVYTTNSGCLRVYNPNFSGGWSFRTYDSTKFAPPSMGQTTHITYSTANSHMSAFMQGYRLADISADIKGAPTFSTSTASAPYYIDNIRVTKLVDPNNMAALTISDTAFEADNDEAVIYISKDVNEKDLKAAVTLKENGVEVNNFNVEKVNTASVTSGENYGNAYRIIKTDSFASDKNYKLTVDGLCSNDYTANMKAPWSKAFRINQLYANDFSNSETVNWELKQTNPSADYQGENTAVVENGVLKLTAGAKNSDQQVLTFDYDNMKEMSDYTVEFDLTAVTAPNGNWLRFGIGEYNQIGTVSGFHIQAGGIRSYVKDSGFDFTNTEIVTGETYRYKMTVKNGRYILYKDGVKITDYMAANPVSQGAFVIKFLNDNCEYKFDNISITKLGDVKDTIDIENVYINDGALNTISGQNTVSLKVNAESTFKTAKQGIVLAAAYKENGEMTNVRVLHEGDIKAGANTFEIDTFEVRGGTTLKVFVFNSMENLTPYCRPAVK